MQTAQVCDIAIIGGGVAGLTLALQLRKSCPTAKITLLEKSVFPLPDKPCKVGESTVEVAAHYFSEVLGLTEHLKSEQLPKLGLRIIFSAADNNDMMLRPEFGSNEFFPRKTFQLDRAILENYLTKECDKNNITIIDNCTVKQLELSASSAAHSIEFTRENNTQLLNCRWLVDASGRKSLIQRNQGLKTESPHDINAVWFRLEDKVDLDTWSNDPNWIQHHDPAHSRWYSTNHLVGEGYWVWIIPLSRQSTSIGIVADPRVHPLSEFNSFELAVAWLEKHEPICAKQVKQRAHLLQDFLALKHLSKKVSQVFSANRWAIVGDAGVFIDPYYSPGMDFIAFSNTFVTDIISRELKGGRVTELTRMYDQLYLSFADNTFQLYQDQYPIFKTPQVMSAKIVWDFALYWSFFAFLFCNDRICDINLLARFSADLELLSKLNKEMQEFFRSWSKSAKSDVPHFLIDIHKNKYLFNLQKNLTLKVNDQEFRAQLANNIEELKYLAFEISCAAIQHTPAIKAPKLCEEIKEHKNRIPEILALLKLA